MRFGRCSLITAIGFVAISCGGASAVTSSASQSTAPTPPAPPSAAASIADQVRQLISSPHDSVKSSDGRAELLIAPGSLPAGTSPADIKVIVLNPTAASLRFDGQPPLFAYRFEPDGLRFGTQPILQMSVDLPQSGEIPLLFTDSGTGVSRLVPIATEVDTASRQVVFTARLAHFSQVEGRGGFFTVTLSELQDHVWGDPFQMKAVIAKGSRSKLTVTQLDGSKLEVRPVSTVQLYGRWWGGFMEPSVVYPAPPPTTLQTDTFTLLQAFSCRGIHKENYVDYDAYLWYTYGVGDVVMLLDGWEEISVTSARRKCKSPVGPIDATFDQSHFMTTYTVEVKVVPALGNGTWSGPNCGTWETLPDRLITDGKKILTFVWHHPHPPCGPTPNHEDVWVQVSFPIVKPPGFRWFCRYNGAASGTGGDCLSN